MAKKVSPKPAPAPLPPPSAPQQHAIAIAKQNLADRTPRLTTSLETDDKGAIANIGAEHSDHDGWMARMQDLFGSNGKNFPLSQLNQILQVARAANGSYDKVKVNALLAAVEGAKPTNEVQAMLAVQMVVTHELAMQVALRSMRVDQVRQFDSAGNMAVKLLRTFTMQVEALAKLQRGGEQVVKVVHVHPGAQAIVGNVTTGANGATGGGGANETQHRPHAKGELPAPSAALLPQVWSEDAPREPVPIPSRGRKESL